MKKKERILKVNNSETSLDITGYKYTNGIGPKIIITSGIHGDEITSIAATWYLMDKLDSLNFKGEVTIFPIVNKFAVETNSRTTLFDGIDLNRSFPGRTDGSTAERIAHALIGELKDNEYLIDVHTAGFCIPFTMYDLMLEEYQNSKLKSWASMAGFPVVGEMNSDLMELQGLTNTWTAYAASKGKYALTIELPGFHNLSKKYAIKAANAIESLIVGLSSPEKLKYSIKNQVFRLEIYSDYSGLLEADELIGKKIKKGELLGKVRNYAGKTIAKIYSPNDGLVIAQQPIPSIKIGSYLFTLAVKKKS